jgi:hypothetical protein
MPQAISSREPELVDRHPGVAAVTAARARSRRQSRRSDRNVDTGTVNRLLAC